MCRTSDVLTQTVLAEHVDDVRVELASGDAWRVKVADDDKSVAEQHDLLEHVGHWSVNVDVTVPGGL